MEGFTCFTIEGAQAQTFLQGQLTNDVSALAPGEGQWQGYCQPQGRLLATFPLVCTAADTYWVALPTGIAAALIKRLSMFVLRAKVKIVANDDALLAFAYGAPANATRLGQTAFFVQKVPTAQLVQTWEESTTGFDLIAQSRWLLAAARAGIAMIDAGAQDLFVPQTVGWDIVGVSFKKGCYPGQEVVARAHYRGAVKRKPAISVGSGALLPPPGCALAAGDNELGHIVAAFRTGDQAWEGLAAIHQDPLAAPSRTFEIPDLGRVELFPLPLVAP
jgi:hypothetical protein